jgi:hypothetical protein
MTAGRGGDGEQIGDSLRELAVGGAREDLIEIRAENFGTSFRHIFQPECR